MIPHMLSLPFCAGLGARDSLRLAAGLCLYGHDMDDTITPGEQQLLTLNGYQAAGSSMQGNSVNVPSIILRLKNELVACFSSACRRGHPGVDHWQAAKGTGRVPGV